MTQCNFRVGQKVVCVDDEAGRFNVPGFSYSHLDFPIVKGAIYTVAALTEGRIDFTKRVVLAEVPLRSETDDGYDRRRFRPVVQRKTDISVFKALLTPSKEKVEIAS